MNEIINNYYADDKSQQMLFYSDIIYMYNVYVY